MKKLMGILLAASMVFSLAACGSTADTAASSAAGTTATAEGSSNNQAPDVKVGAIILGDETEGYSAAHINGIKEAAAELGMSDDQIVWKYKIAEGGVTADAAEDLVGQGCNLIISNSYGHQTYMEEEAEKYPDINFVAMTGDFAAISGCDNFYNAFTAVYQSRYVSGVVAGMKVKDLVESGTLTPETQPDSFTADGKVKIGYVGAYNYAEVVSGYTAFYLGAKSVNPDVTMYVNYTNEWSDATKEATNAKALIDQGCDVISQHSDTSAPATTAQNNGVFAVGYNDDMIPVAPDAALVSARVNWGAYYEYALKCLIDGEAIDQDWCGSYAEGACYLSPFNDAIIADGTKEAIEKAAAGLADGSVQVFAGPLHGKDADGNELNLAEGEYYKENEKGSSPTFTYIVDGVTVLS